MGTSKSISTPTGGNWSSLKNDITSQLGGGAPRCTPATLVGRTVQGAGGVGTLASTGVSRGGAGGGGGVSGGGTRASRAISGLGGFGASIAAQGLGQTLDQLGLGELRGRPAVEVIARVAEHLSSHAEDLDRPLLSGALRDTLLEVANLDDSLDYRDLSESLESFLEENGVEGLVEVFLANLIYHQVWCLLEQWVGEKSEFNRDTEAFQSSVDAACRQLVRGAMSSLSKDGRFESVDWFGIDGADIGKDIVRGVERRLNAAANEEA